MNARGYLYISSVRFLEEKLGKAEASRALEAASPELRNILANAKDIDWYPMPTSAELNRIIGAELGKGDEDRTREAIISLGKHMAYEATNTFLRLIMRVLTPSLFAKKLPDLWRRDFDGGNVEVEVDERRLIGRLSNVKGFDHCACTAVGFASFALQNMGKSIAKTTLHGWSLADPGPEKAWFELEWKA
jgi:hypothetical protein